MSSSLKRLAMRSFQRRSSSSRAEIRSAENASSTGALSNSRSFSVPAGSPLARVIFPTRSSAPENELGLPSPTSLASASARSPFAFALSTSSETDSSAF